MQNLAQGEFKLDLSGADLEFPNGRNAGDIHVQFTPFSQINIPIEPIAFPHWMYAIQPVSIKVNGEVAVDLAIPALNNRYDYAPPDGSYVLMLGMAANSKRVVPIGVGQVNNLRVQSVGELHVNELDYLGFALMGADAQGLLQQYAEGRVGIQPLLIGLQEGE